MTKIRCPHCGTSQELFPHIILCRNCYGDLRGEFEKHSSQTISVEKPPAESGPAVRKYQAIRKYPLKKIGPGNSSLFDILGKTGCLSFKRFFPLFPLCYFSVFFFLLIGIFISKLGLPIVFPEYFPLDPSLRYLAGGGILTCLLASLYTQTALLLAVSNQHLDLGDVLAKAWSRLVSYTLLILLMAIIIGLGYSILILPGVIAIVLLIFAPFILAAENVGVTEAISKSVSYVAHDWLRVFLCLAPVPLLIIFSLMFFAYGGTPILWVTRNAFAFVVIVSAVISVPFMLMTLYIYHVYDDLRKSLGVVLPADSAISPLPQTTVELPSPVLFSSQELSPFFEMLQQAWKIFQERFFCLSVLNLVSYFPHVLNLSVLVAAYVIVSIFIDAFGLKGDFGAVALLFLPRSVHILIILGIMLFGVLYLCSAILGLITYLHLELAFVYAIADATLPPWQALKKSRARLRGFFRSNLHRKFILITSGVLLFPGCMFWVWYEFTPFIFAMEREGQTPLSSLVESRELVRNLWGPVLKRMISLRMLPILVISVLSLILIAGLPFQQIFVLFLSIFSRGMPPAGMPSLHDPTIWLLTIAGLYFYTLFFQIPLQKVFLYLLYTELKEAKNSESVPSQPLYYS